MLVWESQGFDLEKVWFSQEAVDVDAQGMCGELANQTSAQAPECVGIVLFNSKLSR